MARALISLPVPTDGSAKTILPMLDGAFEGGPAVLPIPPRIGGAANDPTDEQLAGADDDPDDPTVAVLSTSGSSGTAKQVMLQASALSASAASTERFLGGPGSWLLALPGWHIAGLQVILRSRLAGTPLVAMDTGTPFTAGSFVAAARQLEGDRRYVSLVPTQLHRILEVTAATDSLAEFDAVLVGGVATTPALLEHALAQGIRVVTTYGMSETCGGCVYGGQPLDVAQVSLSDTGRISLTGPMVARGYRGRPGADVFQPAGTFVTDDLGVLHGVQLQVLGRADEMIISGGVNVAPTAVERVLAAIPGIGEVLVVGVADPEWGSLVTAVVTGTVPDGTVLARAFAAGPAAHRPRRVVRVDTIPLRGPGKPDRAAARLLVADS